MTFSDADFGEVTVNGQTSAAYSAQGAGVIFHMSAFTQMYNTLVVKKSDGTTKATFMFIIKMVLLQKLRRNRKRPPLWIHLRWQHRQMWKPTIFMHRKKDT